MHDLALSLASAATIIIGVLTTYVSNNIKKKSDKNTEHIEKHKDEITNILASIKDLEVRVTKLEKGI